MKTITGKNFKSLRRASAVTCKHHGNGQQQRWKRRIFNIIILSVYDWKCTRMWSSMRHCRTKAGSGSVATLSLSGRRRTDRSLRIHKSLRAGGFDIQSNSHVQNLQRSRPDSNTASKDKSVNPRPRTWPSLPIQGKNVNVMVKVKAKDLCFPRQGQDHERSIIKDFRRATLQGLLLTKCFIDLWPWKLLLHF